MKAFRFASLFAASSGDKPPTPGAPPPTLPPPVADTTVLADAAGGAAFEVELLGCLWKQGRMKVQQEATKNAGVGRCLASVVHQKSRHQGFGVCLEQVMGANRS